MGKSLEEIWPRHKLSFRDAINTFVHHILGIVLVPKFLWGLPITYMRKSKEGYDEFGGYLQDLINRERRLGKISNRQNLLSMLIKHAITTDGMSSGTLQEQEIKGNAFMLLIAAHDTTYIHMYSYQWQSDDSGHTLLYLFIMLALHPAVQDTLFEEIQNAIGTRIPTYDDFANLVTHCASCSKSCGCSHQWLLFQK